MLVVEKLSKAYGKSTVKAVHNISFSIKAGEIFGFLGPNGAGKTTTLKMITGVIAPDSGSVLIDGVDIAVCPIEAKRRIGYVSDNPEIFMQLKAIEYLNFIGDVYDVEDGQRYTHIEYFAGKFGIADVLNNTISSFSRGMKQKLMITASLLANPLLWILDEPMVGLDPKSAFQLKGIMRERADNGKAVLFSTHVMEVAEKVCDRIAIIDKGAIRFVGSIDALRSACGSDASLEQLFLDLTEKTPQSRSADTE